MSELRSVVTEWIELKNHISQARKDLNVLAKREKALAEVIKQNMVQQDVDDIKVQDKKVRLRTRNSKGSITKDVIQNGLTSYFSGDEVKVEGAMKAILDSAPVRQTSSLSVLKGGESKNA